MFDVGFWELMLIGVVALLVVGPERLPKLAYTAGKWLGKGRSMLSTVKSEIDKEIKSEELKKVLEEQKRMMNPMEEIIEETSSAVKEIKNETENVVQDAQKQYASDDQSDSPPGPAGEK
jgi:sec-independent protein translocase protein TatB